jgi:Uma2 family endonuclease
MAEPAIRRMNLEDFLHWDGGTDTRYELIDGFPVAMAPPAEAHRILAVRLVSRIDAALAGRRPCNAQIEPGVVRPDRANSYYVPDIAVTCEPNEAGRQAMVDPILIVEILSPSTERTDRRLRLPAYQTVASVREIMLIDADSHQSCRALQTGERPLGHPACSRRRSESLLNHGRPWDLDVRAVRGDRHPHRGCWFLTH